MLRHHSGHLQHGREVRLNEGPEVSASAAASTSTYSVMPVARNQTTISGARPSDVNPREEKAWTFWEAVTKIPNIFNRKESVAAQAALLKAIARAYFDILWSRRPECETVAEQFLEALPKIDFSHENPLWNIEHMKEEELLGYSGLTNFLPENWRQKQIGEVVEGKVRFGSRHNESILVLPGIVRYLAKLPPRPSESK